MMVELKLKQDLNTNQKRWFQDDYFDLFIWQNNTGQFVSFQLCYDRLGNERVITWDKERGFAHHRVDDGEASPHKNMTPVLIKEGVFSHEEVIPRFIESSQEISAEVRDFILQQLYEYLKNPYEESLF